MLISGIPYKFQFVWGQNATSGFVTDPIPATTGSGIAASQSLGFPPATAQPTGGGGTPPDIDDFNGAYKYVTEWAQWQQAGAPVAYDGTFQTNVSGYPAGAILASATVFAKYWLSLVDNNITDPDTGGSGWVQWPPLSSQLISASGNVTVPDGVTRGKARLWGAGGGGGGSLNGGAACGGGGGGYREGFLSVAPGDVIAATIGPAGAGGSVLGSNGVAGGTTSFSSLSATGGQGGFGVTSTTIPTPGGPGGTGGGGLFGFSGQAGTPGSIIAGTYNGGVGGGSFSQGITTVNIGGGAGQAGFFPGQGGCGAGNGTFIGGNGAPGSIIVDWY